MRWVAPGVFGYMCMCVCKSYLLSADSIVWCRLGHHFSPIKQCRSAVSCFSFVALAGGSDDHL